MKKWLISFLLLTSLFFVGISSSKAYISEVHYNYEEMYKNLTPEQITFLNDAINMLKDTPYHFFIVADNFKSNGCQFTISQADYNERCTPSNAPITNFGLRIFNPAYYDKDSYLGFAVSSGNTRDTVGTFGVLTGTYLNKNTGSFLASDLSNLNINNDLVYSALINPTNYREVINNFLNNPTYNFRYLSMKTIGYSNNTTTGVPFNITYVPYLIYKNFHIPLVNVVADTGIGRLTYINNQTYIDYNGESTRYSNTDSDFPFLFNFLESQNSVTVNSVKDFGNNTFGFYQNIVDVSGATLDGPADSVGVICEENKPFQNGYCSLDYEDLKNKNSDISVFNNYGMMFIQMFGNNTGYLYNDKYYLYSFRVQKPFVPSVGNLFINSFNDNTIKTNILNVWALDGGSYTDYIVKFKIENSDYNADTNLKNIMVVFKNGLGSYYNNNIPSSFNFSVYRSFKLQYFDNEPTNLDVNNFHNTNDLSTIDGISSQTSFFTDNEFNSFGFGGIITAPFRFLYALENYDSCSDITVPFPHSNQNLTLTCVRKNIPSSLNPLIVILQVILSGIITYRIAVGTLRIIKDVSSPDNANIEVVDL